MEWYEALFFCVRDRLECSDWVDKIIRDMSGPELLYGIEELNEQQRHTVYRLFGYFGGSHILAQTIGAALPPRHSRGRRRSAQEWIDDLLRAKIRRTAEMSVARFNKRNVRLLFKLHLEIIQQESMDRVSQESMKRIKAGLAECLRCLEGIPRSDGGEACK